MAKVALIGPEQAAAAEHLSRLLALDSHQIIQYQWEDTLIRELLDADIVFAVGEPTYYMPLLRRVREARPSMPFIVVARITETKEWLDALQAGATDYCSTADIEARQLRWLMECALPRHHVAGA